MDILYIRISLLSISLLCITWGGLIAFSNKYFSYWQNTYWKEKHHKQWSRSSVKVNRWGTGLGALIFGIALAYFVFFQIN
jgi:hypothetical protein